MVNPATKSTEPSNTRPLLFTSAIPVAYERYPGTRGITQGEKKETSPAKIATAIAISKLPSNTIFINNSRISQNLF